MEFDNPFEHKNLKAGSLGGRGCGSYGLRILPGGEERGRVSREESEERAGVLVVRRWW
jgi:hypothetical protein